MSSPSSLTPSLVLLHIGEFLPAYFIHTLYQTLLIHQTCFVNIYIIVNKTNIPTLKKHISNFELYDKEILNMIHFIPVEILKKHYDIYEEYTNIMLNHEKQNPDLFKFRNQFWKVSTERFYYIYSFMLKYNLSNIFHLETDVMIYTPIPTVYENICMRFSDKLWVVQDSKYRAIGSIVFIPSSQVLYQFLKFSNAVLSKTYVNDMTLLGKYPLKYKFPDTPTIQIGMFDGAALGQYLGGIDLRNSKEPHHKYINHTIGFINETSDFKPNLYKYNTVYDKTLQHEQYPTNLKKYFCVDNRNNYYQIHNLHIHSKQPYMFSSIFDMSFADLLTFPNILSHCDAIICVEDTYNQNTSNINNIDKVLLVKDPQSINTERFYSCLSDIQKETITCFIWDNLLDTFLTSILPTSNFTFIIITNAKEQYLSTLKLAPNINRIYTLSPLTLESDIIKFLPCISSVVSEDDHLDFYGNIVNTYMYSKSSIVHFNEDSHFSDITKSYFMVCKSLNSVWVSLYLGVIPVFVLSEDNLHNLFVEKYATILESLHLPYIVMTPDLITTKTLNKNTYNMILNNVFSGKSIYCNDILKISSYFK